jgi:hypothetical protein
VKKSASMLVLLLLLYCVLASFQSTNCSELGGLHYVYWDFPLDRFTSLSIDIEILTEPSNEDGLYYQMYQGRINGVGFYFGLQTQTYKPGYGSMGKGLIFSRWETTDLSNVRIVEKGWSQNATYEGDFVGVRRTYNWTTHAYRLTIALNDTDNIGDWYAVRITDINMQTTDLLGAIRFPKIDHIEDYGIADGGITWTELYSKEEPGTPIPNWHVSIIGIYADEQEIPPYRAISVYSEKEHTDIYFEYDTREIHFIMGPDVTRTHSPGVLFTGLPPLIQYKLTRQVVGSGTTISFPGRFGYIEGTEISVEAFPDSGWIFDHWILDGVDAGIDNPITVIMDANHTLAAVFEEFPFPTQASIESCNSTGFRKDTFDLGEAVFVNGSGYSPSATYEFYFVDDVEIWMDGMVIPSRVLGTITEISSNMTGHIAPTIVWNNPNILGKFDLLVDVNSNGIYDAEIDALDNNDVEVSAGVVIPEFPSWIILPLFIVATLVAIICKKRLRKTQIH